MNFTSPAKGKRIPFLYIISAFVIAVSYFLTMKNDFDADIGHFAFGSVTFYICAAFTVISALFAVMSFYGSKKYDLDSYPGNNALLYFGVFLAAILSLIIFVLELKNTGTALPSADVSPIKEKAEFLEMILTPFIAPALLLSLFQKTKVSRLRAVLTVIAVLSVNLSMFANYFNFAIPLNSPVRNYTTIVDSVVILFLLSEARLAFPAEEKRASYAFSVFSSSLAASIGLGISTGMILHRLICPIPNDPNPDLYHCALYFAISIIAAVRIFSLTKCAKEAEPAPECAEEN